MPVIAVANSKGGSGKTTTALLLACEIAQEVPVVLIDADPRRPLVAWAELGPPPVNVEVISSGGEREIQDEIATAATRVPFVVVDLEGTASRLASYAMAEADLVLVPTQEQHQDAQAAVDTLSEVGRAGRAARRAIPAVIVLTRTKAAVKSRTARHVGAQLKAAQGVHVLAVELVERDAFAALFASGGDLRGLDCAQVNGVERAVDNVAAFASEVIAVLREHAHAQVA